jgi:hypothetical protein
MQTILLFFLSLLGIGAGFLVSMIAIEELKQGKKYFKYLKNFLLLLISVFFVWQTVILEEFVALGIFILVMIGIIVLDYYKKTLRVEIAYYSLFLISLLYLNSIGVTIEEKILFSTLIALYGFVPGTLLHIRLLEGKMRKYS